MCFCWASEDVERVGSEWHLLNIMPIYDYRVKMVLSEWDSTYPFTNQPWTA